MQTVPFIKMHGIGNDFVVIDLRTQKLKLTKALIHFLCQRNTGIGCDQLVTISSTDNQEADVKVRFYNPDGSESGTCGNASRCVADLMMKELDRKKVVLQTRASILQCERVANQISVNMGKAAFDWWKVPLSKEADTMHLNIGEYKDGVALNVGNPHIVFFVKEVDIINLEVMGPRVEHDPIFPERTNVSIVQILQPNHIKLRVWERGTGITLACGSAACAATVAAHRRGLINTRVDVDLPGGCLNIELTSEEEIWMTGAVAQVFKGSFEIE